MHYSYYLWFSDPQVYMLLLLYIQQIATKKDCFHVTTGTFSIKFAHGGGVIFFLYRSLKI